MNSLLKIANLSKYDKTKAKFILENISFELFNKEKLVISGSSGSGKTVLLKCLSLLEIFDSGTVTFEEKNVKNLSLPLFRAEVIYLNQKPTFFEGTVCENLEKMFFLSSHKNKKIDKNKLISWVKLFNKDIDFLNTPVSKLSGGESQIVNLIRALQLEPKILLLDEPTSALDKESVIKAEKLISEWFTTNNNSYIWVTHDAEQEHRVSDRVITLKEGRILK